MIFGMKINYFSPNKLNNEPNKSTVLNKKVMIN